MRSALFMAPLLLLLCLLVVRGHRDREEVALASGRLSSPDRPAQTAAAHARNPEPGRLAAGSARRRSVLAAGDLSVLESEEPVPMVRYFDARGALHMVRGLDRVPVAHRADAVVVGRGNVNLVSIPAPTAVAFRDWEPDPDPHRSGVVLFSAPWCGACKRARRYLDHRGVAHLERDIDADDSAKQEVREILGRVAVPLLEVGGRYVSGFRPDVYDRALGEG